MSGTPRKRISKPASRSRAKKKPTTSKQPKHWPELDPTPLMTLLHTDGKPDPPDMRTISKQQVIDYIITDQEPVELRQGFMFYTMLQMRKYPELAERFRGVNDVLMRHLLK